MHIKFHQGCRKRGNSSFRVPMADRRPVKASCRISGWVSLGVNPGTRFLQNRGFGERSIYNDLHFLVDVS